MQYVFDFYIANADTTWRRVDTDTSHNAIADRIVQANQDQVAWRVVMTDGLTDQTTVIESIDSFEEICEVHARAYSWSDAEAKQKKAKLLREKFKDHVAMGWKPFDEQETGIHLKQEAESLAAKIKDAETSEPEKGSIAAQLRKRLDEFTPIDSNVKTAAAVGKPTISDVPVVGFFALGAAMNDGAKKYGRFNWRSTEVTTSVFIDAMARHLLGYYAGEDHASDSKIHHLAHLMAGGAIMLDAELHGVLRDDRDKADPKLIDAIMKLIKKDNG